jgi:hypothetical protein
MPARLVSRFARVPRYAAELPWFGPILGREANRGQRVGGACDPALGKSFAAVLAPARRASERLDAELAQAWIAPTTCDRRGRFAIDLPPGLARPERPALFVALLYDQSAALLRSGGRSLDDGALQTLEASLRHAQQLQPGPIARLPQREREEIVERLRRLLLRPMKDLELALIELDGRPGGVPAASSLSFAVASCQYPAGFLDRDVAGRSYRRLAECLEPGGEEPRPRCLLLLGDQVYVDATAGLFDPTARYDRYELPYERLLRMPAVRQVLRRLPVYAMLDDHEIEDNWEPAPDEATEQQLRYGRRSYLRYQRIAGPRQVPPVGDSRQPLWYEFDVDGFPFFMADTRTERQARCAQTVAAARIMSRAQHDALLGWLDRHKRSEVPKFICSPSALLPRHRRATRCGALPADPGALALRSDTWHGYPASFEPLLGYIADQQIRNVVFLSGDEHISFVTRALVRPAGSSPGVLIHSIHSSALYAPFAFANSLPEDLAEREAFDFGANRYRCTVHTRFAPPGDGFTVVHVAQARGRWVVQCRFHRNADRVAHRSPLRMALAR